MTLLNTSCDNLGSFGAVGDGRLEAVIDYLLARNDFGSLLGRERVLPVEHAGDVGVPVIKRQDVERLVVPDTMTFFPVCEARDLLNCHSPWLSAKWIAARRVAR